MGFVQIWPELRKTRKFRGIDAAKLRAWMLPKLTLSFIDGLRSARSEEDADVAAKFFIVGPTEVNTPDVNVNTQDSS